MKLGYLHLGERRHGIHRYGRLLAGAASRQADTELIEEEVVLGGDWSTDSAALRAAAESLSRAEVVHIQYNRSIWGDGFYQIRALRSFTGHCSARLVASLHDVYPRDPWQDWKRKQPTLERRVRRWFKGLMRRTPGNYALRLLFDRCEAVLVCFEIERERLSGFGDQHKMRVIGHFVEPRSSLPDRQESRNLLGVGEQRVVTVLGYIHPRKGYDLVVDALPLLPDDILVVFAGMASPGNESTLQRWLKRARKQGQEHRLRVTGYLEEDDQARWLVATDLGVCPFRFFSASGSMTTWISAGRPVLCHALAQIEEYRKTAPEAFHTFEPYSAEAFAAAVIAALEQCDGQPDPQIVTLRDAFALERIGAEHRRLFEELLASADRPAATR